MQNAPDTPAAPGLPAVPFWKKLLLGLALSLGILGAVLYGLAPAPPGGDSAPAAAPADQVGTPGLRAQSFNTPRYTPIGESAPPLEQVADDTLHLSDWSGFFMKLGFSFVVGFSVGYAAAGFLRLTLFVFGAVCLLLFGLQYAGLIQVNWGGMEGFYNSFIVWLKPHIGSFKDFITGNLSSSGLAAAGLFIGFKK